MRWRLVFANPEAAARTIAEIETTAAIEGGAGPVRMGVPGRLADGRLAMAHESTEADFDWLRAYLNDAEAEVEAD